MIPRMTRTARKTRSPIPYLTLRTDTGWEGAVILTEWADLRIQPGFGLGNAARGSACLHVSAPEGEKEPSREQARTYEWLLEHQAPLRDAVLKALLPYYKSERTEVTFGDPEQEARLLPPIRRVAEFQSKGLLQLIGVHLHREPRGGLCPIGIELACTWDNEHNAGVLTHREKILEVGQADTAFGY
jgi:hypothetical protein